MKATNHTAQWKAYLGNFRVFHLLPLLLMLPTALQAQFTYITSNGAITITGYSGPGDAVTVPGTINGLPVTGIGDQAFFGTALAGVVIPDSVTGIGFRAFGNCSSLTNITVAGDNPAYTSLNGVLFDKSQTTLVAFPAGIAGSYAVPASVAKIGNDAFHDSPYITGIALGNGITNIDYGAFWGCRKLADVVLPSSITSIADHAFDGCWSLPSMIVPAGVTHLGARAFADCVVMTNVSLGDRFTGLGEGAFWKCLSLPKVAIPNSVTSIGDNAFWQCYGLTSITIPGGVTNIGDSAFFLCTYLTNITFLGNAPALTGGCCWFGSVPATVYYYYGASGWGSTYGGLPTVMLNWLPRLNIQRAGLNQILVSWPAPSTGFVLQETSTLNPNGWTDVPESPIQIGDQNVVVIAPPTGNRIYRLKLE